ncbi:hypothetical protein ACRALDRAFT_2020966 [Sodiomyces alcalophilus JCM 7366]|uniref:uncharacterized protein n=1 Tax=Sodiomyces alcalophilus JCM 7366 TaxID=591952 RepID=UPI0039B3C737
MRIIVLHVSHQCGMPKVPASDTVQNAQYEVRCIQRIRTYVQPSFSYCLRVKTFADVVVTPAIIGTTECISQGARAVICLRVPIHPHPALALTTRGATLIRFIRRRRACSAEMGHCRASEFVRAGNSTKRHEAARTNRFPRTEQSCYKAPPNLSASRSRADGRDESFRHVHQNCVFARKGKLTPGGWIFTLMNPPWPASARGSSHLRVVVLCNPLLIPIQALMLFSSEVRILYLVLAVDADFWYQCLLWVDCSTAKLLSDSRRSTTRKHFDRHLYPETGPPP